MIRKFALGLVAAVALGRCALAPTAASAFSVKVGVGSGWHPHYHPSPPPRLRGSADVRWRAAAGRAPSCLEKRLVQTRKGLRWRTVNVCAF